MKFKFTIKISDESENVSITPIIIEKELEGQYLAQNELRNMGVNGIIISNDDSENSKTYFPPHRIIDITLAEIKNR